MLVDGDDDGNDDGNDLRLLFLFLWNFFFLIVVLCCVVSCCVVLCCVVQYVALRHDALRYDNDGDFLAVLRMKCDTRKTLVVLCPLLVRIYIPCNML